MAKFEPFKSPRIDVNKYIKTVRPKDPEALTAAQISPYLTYLLLDSAIIAELARQARDEHLARDYEAWVLGVLGPITGQVAVQAREEVERQLDTIDESIRDYQDRLYAYEPLISGSLGIGPGDLYTMAVARSLFLGLFDNSFKHGLTDNPACMDPSNCYKSTPDFAMPVLLRNQLAAYVQFDEQQWEKLIDGTVEAGKDVFEAAVETLWRTSGSGALYNLFRDRDDKDENDETPAWKYALYGGAAVLGSIALIKILR